MTNIYNGKDHMIKYPSVSLIISNLNGKDYLRDCLKSLKNLDYEGTYEIIVVDAGSTDGAPEMVEKEFPCVVLLKEGRIGIGEAINIGIQNANGELIGFDLNSDEVFSKDWLSVLVEVLLSNERIGVVGGTRLIYGTDEIIDDSGVYTNWISQDLKLGRGRTLSEISQKPREVTFTTTVLFRKNLLKKIGGCDEEFYIFFEESDFCERVRKIGYKIVNVPKSISYHRISATVGKFSPRSLYFLRRGRVRFIIKNYSIGRMLTALLWWVILQTIIDASMLIPLFNNVFSNTRLKFITKRGTKDHIISVLKALIWNVKNFNSTMRSRKVIQILNYSILPDKY